MFEVEDGSGKVNANSYVALTFADEYFAARGVAQWTGTDELKQGWLVQATDYVERFKAQFEGCPLTQEQSLHFPVKDGRFKDKGVPTDVLKAVCEYALIAKNGPLAPNPVYDASGARTYTAKKKVGPIEKSFSVIGGDSARATVVRSYPAADALLLRVCVPRPSGNRTIR